MNKNSTPTSQHVIVSGGSRGLGMSIVQQLIESGYSVSTFSRRATEFTDRLREHPKFLFCTADASNVNSLMEFTEAACKRFGSPYGLVNCAGFAVEGVLATMKEKQIDEVLATNLGGALQLTRLVTRRMLLSRSSASIINISSIIGIRGYSGLSAYAATKGGMDAMTRSLARELGDRGIRVNSIAPGYLDTEMTTGLSAAQKLQIVRRTPMGRLGQASDIVGAVQFLLSESASFMTGQILVIDGGITA